MTAAVSESPRVSVVLPVRNEGAAFRGTLDRILAQDYPADRIEILVVDGASEDGTRRVAEEVARQSGRVRVLDNPRRIVPTAMNVALRHARGEVIVRVDGHTLVEPDYVRRCVEALRVSGAECVGGGMTPDSKTFFGEVVAAATSTPFGVGNSRFHYGREPVYTDSAYMGAWPADVFRRLGGFDEEMVRNQDDELSYRIVKMGGRVYFDPAIRSVYRPRESPRKLWRQYLQYGFYKVRVLQKHPSVMSLRHFVPAAAVLAGLGVGAAALLTTRGWRLAAAVGAVYVVAGLVAASRLPIRGAVRAATPVAFAIIHAAYGCGFLTGLVRFLPRWWHPRGRVAAIPVGSNEEGRGR